MSSPGLGSRVWGTSTSVWISKPLAACTSSTLTAGWTETNFIVWPGPPRCRERLRPTSRVVPVNRFRARNRSEATLKSSPIQVWDVLTDPALLPKLTPYLKRIDVDGDRWTWNLTRIPVMSATITPTFTEVMTFEQEQRIGFAHDPAKPDERTGVEGEYVLSPRGQGTHVAIDLEIWCDLPLPRMARLAVEGVMRTVVGVMGNRFAANMLRHLGE